MTSTHVESPALPQANILGGKRTYEILTLLAIFVVTAIIDRLSIDWTQRVDPIAAIWPANAIVLAILWRVYGRLSASVLFATFLGNVVANMLERGGIIAPMVLSASNLVEITIAFYLLKRLKVELSEVSSWQDITRFVIATALIAPILSSIIASAYFAYAYSKDFLPILQSWYIADALGMVVFAPTAFLFSPGKIRDVYRKAGKVAFIASWIALAIALLITFGQSGRPLLYVVYPALAVVTFTGGITMTALATLVMAIVAVFASSLGYGPLGDTRYDLVEKAYMLQSYIAIAILTMLPLGALAQRQRKANEEITALYNSSVALRLEAEAASRAKSAFLTSMSHELRTPLNAVSTLSQLLLATPKSMNKKQVEYVGIIETAAGHLTKLIDSVLDLAKITSGNVNINEKEFSAAEVLESARKLLLPLTAKNHIELRFPQVDSEIFVKGDPAKVLQVLLNLGSNAIKYGKPNGYVEFSVEVKDGVVTFAATDNGKGIAADKQSGVFQAFNRCGQETSNIEGAGVGLAICKELVNKMNGIMDFKSEADKGSTFWFAMPEGKAQPGKPAAETSRVKNAKLGTRAHDVLYVEDNEWNARILPDVFSSFGFIKVHIAKSGKEGLEMARKLQPSLFFLDIHLPDCDGFGLLRQLKEIPGCSDVPAVALTADTSETTRANALEAGFDQFITKPYSIVELQRLIRHYFIGSGN